MADAVICYLGGVPFRAGPDEIRWEFSMKVKETKTMGGKVVQILGTTLGDISVTGLFGTGASGDEPNTNWEEQLRLRQRVIQWARSTQKNQGAQPLRFLFPLRNWDFNVYIKSLNPVDLVNENIAPRWSLTLLPDDEGSRMLTRLSTDVYIQRLMAGVGWKQTDYNGPTAQEVAATLNGQSVGEYLAAQAQAAFESGLPGGQIGLGGDGSQ